MVINRFVNALYVFWYRTKRSWCHCIHAIFHRYLMSVYRVHLRTNLFFYWNVRVDDWVVLSLGRHMWHLLWVNWIITMYSIVTFSQTAFYLFTTAPLWWRIHSNGYLEIVPFIMDFVKCWHLVIFVKLSLNIITFLTKLVFRWNSCIVIAFGIQSVTITSWEFFLFYNVVCWRRFFMIYWWIMTSVIMMNFRSIHSLICLINLLSSATWFFVVVFIQNLIVWKIILSFHTLYYFQINRTCSWNITDV